MMMMMLVKGEQQRTIEPALNELYRIPDTLPMPANVNAHHLNMFHTFLLNLVLMVKLRIQIPALSFALIFPPKLKPSLAAFAVNQQLVPVSQRKTLDMCPHRVSTFHIEVEI